jgi:hypothetical protein
MTRRHLRRTLIGTFVFLGTVLLIAAVARFAYPQFAPETPGFKFLFATYEYLKDMSLLIATGGVAYLTNVYQKRSNFLGSLREEWRDIIQTKSALISFCALERPSQEDYMRAFCRLSETIDNMRIVYRNVGETRDLVGLYPYAPLHDMRRALQTLEPRINPLADAAERKLARDAMLQSFYALRETFLEELDLEEPEHPLLISQGRRLKRSGTTERARRAQDKARAVQDTAGSPRPDVDAFLKRLYEDEQKRLASA